MKLYEEQRSGFLLLELGIGLSLIIVIFCLAIPSLITFQSTLVKIELYKVHQFFLRCRQQAMALNKTISISFDEHERNYYASFCKERLNDAVVFGFPPGTYGPPSSPKNLLSKSITFEQQCVQCYPDGTLQSGALYMTDRNRSCCYALTVPTSGGTCVRIYRSTRGTWSELS